MSSEIVVPWDRPLAARRIIEVLNSGPKLAIIRALLRRNGATAKELSQELGVKIPTVLSHLSDLARAGLVVVDTGEEGGRHAKVYRLAARKVVVEVDLEQFVELRERIDREELREIEALALRYVDEKRRHSILPLAVTVRDVVKTIGIDAGTAIQVVDYINTYTRSIIEHLASEALKALGSRGAMSVRDLAKSLRVHEYWAALVAQELVARGCVVAGEDGRLMLAGRRRG